MPDIEQAILAILDDQRHCGLNADWSVLAWHLWPENRPNHEPGFYLLDNEDDTASLVYRTFESAIRDDATMDITVLHTWPTVEALATETRESLLMLCLAATVR